MSFEEYVLAQQREQWADWEKIFPQYQNSHVILYYEPTNQNPEEAIGLDYHVIAEDKLEQKKEVPCMEENNNGGNTLQEEPAQNDSQFIVRHGRPRRNDRTIRKKKQAYPTNNFLPTFRPSFLNYLKKHYRGREQFERIEIVFRIRNKACINLTDFKDLFIQPAFRQILENYFREKVILRDLMLSRVDAKTKRHYLKRIHVFEEAFISKKFQKINY